MTLALQFIPFAPDTPRARAEDYGQGGKQVVFAQSSKFSKRPKIPRNSDRTRGHSRYRYRTNGQQAVLCRPDGSR